MDELIESDLRYARGAVDDLRTRRAELRRACEAAVVQWQWAREGSDLQRPEPLYRQRYGVPAPRRLEEAPDVPQDEQQYGVDSDGDILVVREFVGPRSFREELRVRRGDTVVGYRWSEDDEPLEVNVARFASGAIRSSVTVWPEGTDGPRAMMHGFAMERYAYEGDLVTEIEDESEISFDGEPAQRAVIRIRASYDPAGRLLDVREESDDGEKVLYRARGSGPSMVALQRRVEDRLVELLPALVRERAGDEPLCCLVLHYHPEWPLPPRVGLGLERDRQAFIDNIDDAETLRLTVWNPAEFSNYRGETVEWDLAAIDPALARAMRAIPQDADGAAERARRTLNRAARRLHELDWPRSRP